VLAQLAFSHNVSGAEALPEVRDRSYLPAPTQEAARGRYELCHSSRSREFWIAFGLTDPLGRLPVLVLTTSSNPEEGIRAAHSNCRQRDVFTCRSGRLPPTAANLPSCDAFTQGGHRMLPE